MRKHLLVFWLWSVGTPTHLAAQLPPADPAIQEEGAVLEEVIELLKDSIQEAQSDTIQGFPPLRSASVTLQTTTLLNRGLQLRFLILTIGSKNRTESASKIVIELKPPTPRSEGTRGDIGRRLRSALARAIHLVKRGILTANRFEPKLDLSRVEIEIKFAVQRERSAQGDTQKLLPLGLAGTGKLSANKVHTLRLVFGN